MKVSYDPTIDSLLLVLSDAPQTHGEELADDPDVIVFYDDDNRAVAFQVLSASERVPRNQLDDLTVSVTVHPDQRLERQPA